MRLSLIITLFNTADYLAACVRSILAQAAPDTELILIDDGSTDASWELAQRLAATDPRIRLARQANQGPSAARNHGLTLATGDYVTFIDSDDTLAPATLARCAALLESHQPDILIYSMQHVREDGEDRSPQDLIIADAVYESVAPLITDLLDGRRLLLYSAANKFYRRSFLQRHDLRFPSEMDFGEDRQFNYACLHHAQCVVTSSHPGYRYHIRLLPSLSRKLRRQHIDTLGQLHRAKQTLIDAFARHDPTRDRYLAQDWLWEIKTACDHLRQHWATLSSAERHREVRHLAQAGCPPYLDQFSPGTFSLKLIRLAVKHRLSPVLYLTIACGRKT